MVTETNQDNNPQVLEEQWFYKRIFLYVMFDWVRTGMIDIKDKKS